MFHIVLVHPQIPPNTGTIGRLCVNTAAKLHIVKPIGFDLSQKALRRAGLDYWKRLDPTVWESLDAFLEVHGKERERFFFATTKSERPYFDVSFQKGDYLFFGSETEGLPPGVMALNPQHKITIPMAPKGRSLNLSVAVGIILYEAIRQNYHEGFFETKS